MAYNYQYVKKYPPMPEIDVNQIYRLPDNTWIPNNPENTDWQAYQVWLSEGNTPLPPDA
jgi:hypothetical protein